MSLRKERTDEEKLKRIKRKKGLEMGMMGREDRG